MDLLTIFMGQKEGNEAVGQSLSELQAAQKDHDLIYHPDLEALPVKGQIAHTHFHLAKVLGVLGDFLEKTDHMDLEEMGRLRAELIEKRVPDALILVLKLANLLEIDLETGRQQRLTEDREKQKKKLGLK